MKHNCLSGHWFASYNSIIQNFNKSLSIFLTTLLFCQSWLGFLATAGGLRALKHTVCGTLTISQNRSENVRQTALVKQVFRAVVHWPEQVWSHNHRHVVGGHQVVFGVFCNLLEKAR